MLWVCSVGILGSVLWVCSVRIGGSVLFSSSRSSSQDRLIGLVTFNTVSIEPITACYGGWFS